MGRDIREAIEDCEMCAYHKRSNPKEPLITFAEDTPPMQYVDVDVFHVNSKNYVAMMDRFSGFIFALF